MAVPDGRRGGDEDGAALFEEEGVDFADEEDIDHSEIPLHLRPLVSAAESGDLNALRHALGIYYCFMRMHTLSTDKLLYALLLFLFLPDFPCEETKN